MLAALPPAGLTDSEIEEVKSAPALAPAVAARKARKRASWARPQVQMGGKFSYLTRRDMGDNSSSEQSQIASLMARIVAPVWQPWVGNLTGDVDYGVSRNDSQVAANVTGSGGTGGVRKTKYVNGRAQLSLLPMSQFPFEAHLERNEGGSLSSVSALDSYTSQRVGFTQNYHLDQGNIMFGLDNSSQDSATVNSGGEYRQRNLQLALTKALSPGQNFALNGLGSRNTQENSGQLSEQRNWLAKHSYRDAEGLTVETTADTTRAQYRLQQQGMTPSTFTFSDSYVRQRQLNSFALWRPSDDPLTMNGGVRVLALENSFDSTAVASTAAQMQMRNANLNVGAVYEFSKSLTVTGSANVNLSSNESMQSTTQTTSSSETAGVNYRQEPVAWGVFSYLLSGGGTFLNNKGQGSAEQQMVGQFSHSLNHSMGLGTGATLGTQFSQAVSAGWDTASNDPRQLTHSAMVMWNTAQDNTTTLLQLSASDARSWDEYKSVVQLITLQATGNLITGEASRWSANLTVQTARQNRSLSLDSNQPYAGVAVNDFSTTITTSNGAVSYQNQRAFGVLRLQFFSDLRLNSQALLPVFAGPEDQASAIWENRLEYAIGRVQLHFKARAAKNGGKVNQSYLFMLSRFFGDI